jgi:predicted dehydrogenase
MTCVAVCDRESANTPISVEELQFYTDYLELLTEDLDILFVCLPNDLAAEVTSAGLRAGLHVFCEKPPGRTLEDIASVMDVERQHPDQRLMYGFNHRYHESVEDALAMMKTGEVGDLISLRGIYGKSKLITFDQPDWRTKRQIAGGGVLLDQGIHMVDLMRLFAGEFTQVHSFISNSHWGYDVEDNAYALMRTEAGVVAMLNSSATQWRHRFSLELTFDKGSMVLGGILSSSKSYGSETLTVIRANPDRDNGDPREQTTLYNDDRSWEKEVAAFATAIAQKEPVVRNGSRDAFGTMALVSSIYYADDAWRATYQIPDPEVTVRNVAWK